MVEHGRTHGTAQRQRRRGLQSWLLVAGCINSVTGISWIFAIPARYSTACELIWSLLISTNGVLFGQMPPPLPPSYPAARVS